LVRKGGAPTTKQCRECSTTVALPPPANEHFADCRVDQAGYRRCGGRPRSVSERPIRRPPISLTVLGRRIMIEHSVDVRGFTLEALAGIRSHEPRGTPSRARLLGRRSHAELQIE
jgi:hypothetical protein